MRTGHPKITRQTPHTNMRPIHTVTPFPSQTGTKQKRATTNKKHLISHATNQTSQHPINGSGTNQPAHTHKHEHERHTNQPNKHWHTIEFSHNTRTPQTQPQNTASSKQLQRPYTHPNQTTKRHPARTLHTRIRQRLFSYRHLTQQPPPGGVCGALSVTLT